MFFQLICTDTVITQPCFGSCRRAAERWVWSLSTRMWQRTQCPSHFCRTITELCTHRPLSATSLLPGKIPSAIWPLWINLCFLALLLLELSAILPCRFCKLEQGDFWGPFQPKPVYDPWIWVLPYECWVLTTGYSNLWQNERENLSSGYFSEVWVVWCRLSPMTPTLSAEAAGY